jgi:hypothetical protein
VRLIFTIDHSPCLFYALAVVCSVLSRAYKRGKLRLSLFLSMAHVKSTAWPVGGAAAGGSGGEGAGSEERTLSMRPSDVGFHSDGGDVRVESSHLQSFYFGPSTVTVSQIREMIDNVYFTNGMGHEPGEETMSEPHVDEAVLFEEFFTTGLRMPLHPVLVAILLKYQVQIHQLTPNTIV